jgi:hypothetical protein
VSLRVEPCGLATGAIPLPGGDSCELRLDLQRHHLGVIGPGGPLGQLGLGEGASASDLGDRALALLSAAGVDTGRVDRKHYADDTPTPLDPGVVVAYLEAITRIDACFAALRSTLDGEVGPVQLWPHHFDLSFEWFSARLVPWEEEGKSEELNAQIGFGFAPGAGGAGDGASGPYFYATPWPFDEELTAISLPTGAHWRTEGWQGVELPYSAVAPAGEEKLAELVRTVFEGVAPRLRA